MGEGDDHLPFRIPDWAALGVHPSELLGDEELDNAPPMPSSVRWGQRSPDELIWLTLAAIEPLEVDEESRPSAFTWWENVSEQLISAAFQFSALDFSIASRSWGVVFEVAFVAEPYADAFRNGPPFGARCRPVVKMSRSPARLGGQRLLGRSSTEAGSASVREPTQEPSGMSLRSRPHHCFAQQWASRGNGL